ncbi:hypothetical protein GJ496_002649 [Pomphorhynchus laevis]|nr:hypothetical protein GJ496_002649 [Pomphorhynchus laevis]
MAEVVGVTLELLKTVQRLIDVVNQEYSSKGNLPNEAKLFLSFCREMQATVQMLRSKNIENFTPGKEFLHRMDIRLTDAYLKLNSIHKKQTGFFSKLCYFFTYDSFLAELHELRTKMVEELKLLKHQHESVWEMIPFENDQNITSKEEDEENDENRSISGINQIACQLIASSLDCASKVNQGLRRCCESQSSSNLIELTASRQFAVDQPRSANLMPNSSILVCSTKSQRLLHFHINGTLSRQKWFAEKPTTMTVSITYIVLGFQENVKLFDFDFEFVCQWGTWGDGENQLKGCYALMLLENQLYVCDTGNSRIHTISIEHNQFKHTSMCYLPKQSQTVKPMGILLVADCFWISDHGNQQILLCNETTFIGSLRPNQLIASNTYENNLFRPSGMCLVNKNFVFICDEAHSWILVYHSLNRSLLSVITHNWMRYPCSISILDDRLLIANALQNTVVAFKFNFRKRFFSSKIRSD